MMTDRCIVVATIEAKGFLDYMKRVYSTDGLAPSLMTMAGGNRQPKIMEEDDGDTEEGAMLRDEACR